MNNFQLGATHITRLNSTLVVVDCEMRGLLVYDISKLNGFFPPSVTWHNVWGIVYIFRVHS